METNNNCLLHLLPSLWAWSKPYSGQHHDLSLFSGPHHGPSQNWLLSIMQRWERPPKISSPQIHRTDPPKTKKMHFYSFSCPILLPGGSRKWNCWSIRVSAKPLSQYGKSFHCIPISLVYIIQLLCVCVCFHLSEIWPCTSPCASKALPWGNWGAEGAQGSPTEWL